MSTQAHLYLLLWLMLNSCEASPRQVSVKTLKCTENLCEELNYPLETEVAYFTEEIAKKLDRYTELVLRNSHLRQFPLNVFKTLEQLEHFDVQDCKVQQVAPECFEGATNLKILQLADNLIDSIDASTFALATKLEILDLANNKLQRLPSKTFAALAKLQQLNLDHNQLAELPAQLFANQLDLQLFSARGNRLKHIAANALPTVQRLIISDNPQLKRLHLAGNIRILQADNCHLQSLKFDQPEQLQQLLLSNSQLQNLDFLHNAINLLDLDLTGLTKLPAMPKPWPAQHLERLSISYENSTNWPDQTLSELPELKVLDIWHDQQREIYIKEGFAQLNNHNIDDNVGLCAQLELFLGDSTLPKHINVFDSQLDHPEGYAMQCPGVELSEPEELLWFDADFDSLT
ncbi:GH18186 [Drosophila grimshawi]|uniref:GH18186 n=1 Tax=Drosophila grimshawi TaxID=7222 RepID=B4JG40_DROGR|nr:GH18186 [Drosophila grimshawi]